MNSSLDLLHPYPFEKLRQLFADLTPDSAFRPISLGIGEPQHATPQFLKDRLASSLDQLAHYPTTQGSDRLRTALGDWLRQRYALGDTQPRVLPVNGTREALFAFAQAVIDRGTGEPPVVVCPNPFYQIYEGATLLAGAQPYYLDQLPENDFDLALEAVPEAIWRRAQLIFVCSPGNPTGHVLGLERWRQLFELSDRYGFVIASDECYSEIYFGSTPPLGSLEAAVQLGRSDFRRLVMFSSLSKRSNAPGLRSGLVAGDTAILQRFLLYRTYQGGAMSLAVQEASIAAWSDEQHVAANRREYAAKFDRVLPMLAEHLPVRRPQAGFYLWARAPIADEAFARRLYAEYNVTVLPGSYLARPGPGGNPGSGFLRLALVAPLAECVEAAERILTLCKRI